MTSPKFMPGVTGISVTEGRRPGWMDSERSGRRGRSVAVSWTCSGRMFCDMASELGRWAERDVLIEAFEKEK